MTQDREIAWEDFAVGGVLSHGDKVMTRDEIVAFARAYDPQPMHIDDAAAKQTLLGGLSASGWHTTAVMMRLICDGVLNRTRSLGAPGIEELRWIKPVRPGDRLRFRATTLARRASQRRPNVGLVQLFGEMLRVDGEGAGGREDDAAGRDGAAAGRDGDAASQNGKTASRRGEAAGQNGEDVVMTTQWWAMFGRRNPGAEPLSDGDPRPAPDPAPPPPPDPGEDAARGFWFEDAPLGRRLALGEQDLTAEEIIDFARRFDPQPFHLDEAAGRASLFGGLAASGWHVAALWMRHMVATRRKMLESQPPEAATALGPSPGFRNLKWLRPALAGRRLAFYMTPVERVALRSRPDWGILRNLSEAVDVETGAPVMTFTGQALVRRRPGDR